MYSHETSCLGARWEWRALCRGRRTGVGYPSPFSRWLPRVSPLPDACL